ncbi:MAG: TonB-dependent receptor domain-containing protein, partial [Bacteroidota bacterium]
QVLANINANQAYLSGVSASLKVHFKFFNFSTNISYTEGRYTTDPSVPSLIYEKQGDGTYKKVSKNVSSKPLDHIPPIFGKSSIEYRKEKWSGEFFCLFNGWKRLDDFNADGEDNAQYATPDGMPAWFTLNVRTSLKISKKWLIQFSAENLLDRNYRNFASGFSAAGRNFIFAVRMSH